MPATRTSKTPRTSRTDLSARRHQCVHGDTPLYFANHERLVYHLIREHFIRASMVPACVARCEMLAPPTAVATAAVIVPVAAGPDRYLCLTHAQARRAAGNLTLTSLATTWGLPRHECEDCLAEEATRA